MRLAIVECDGCGKQVKSVQGFDPRFVPPSWRVMRQEDCEDLFFCSIHCVAIYLRKFFNLDFEFLKAPDEVQP